MHWQLRNKRLVPLEAFPVALLYGYSAYSSFRWPLEARWLSAHLERLRQDAAIMGIPASLDGLEAALKVLEGGQAVRLTVVPEIDSFTELFGEMDSGRVLVSTRPLPPPPDRGLRLKSAVLESPLAGLKHGSLAEGFHLRRQALQAGYDETLWLNASGNLREATTANVFLIQDGALLTPDPTSAPCLPGIMRLQVIEAAGRLGIPCRSEQIPLAALPRAEGVFLSNAVQGLRRVDTVDALALPWPEAAEKRFAELLRELGEA